MLKWNKPIHFLDIATKHQRTHQLRITCYMSCMIRSVTCLRGYLPNTSLALLSPAIISGTTAFNISRFITTIDIIDLLYTIYYST